MPHPAGDTAEILADIRRDKDRVFADLIARYHAGLLSVARGLLRNVDAEDVVQDAWISAWRALEGFEGRSSIRTWLTRIVINEAMMRLRKSGREISFDHANPDTDAFSARFREGGSWQVPPARWKFDGPEDLLQEQDLLDCIRKHLEMLPANQRLVLELRDMQGMEFEEICNTLDLSASNARVLLHRARTAIFTMVDGYQETGQC
jgi:RNA polymerase sigma-70 factor (ECF subfamily)